MAFVSKVYTDDKGFFWLARFSDVFAIPAGVPETPTAGLNVGVHVKSSKSNNSFGVRPRYVTMQNKVGAVKIKRTFPVLIKPTFDAYGVGQEITVGSVVYVITAKKAEKRDAN